VGSDFIKFPGKKNFTSWLRLSPNNIITGGKVFSSRTPKEKNILSNAFCLAANTIAQRKDGALKKNIQSHCIQKRKSYGHHRVGQKAGRNILENDSKQGALQSKK
jgi:hypothetical protein